MTGHIMNDMNSNVDNYVWEPDVPYWIDSGP